MTYAGEIHLESFTKKSFNGKLAHIVENINLPKCFDSIETLHFGIFGSMGFFILKLLPKMKIIQIQASKKCIKLKFQNQIVSLLSKKNV